jgi:hypothetical protein
MSRGEFLQVFNRLSVALREPADDTGVTQSTYFDALNDLTLESLQAGATTLMRETGRKFFPTTAEWRTAAVDAGGELARKCLALPDGRSEPWHSECASCQDTGWVLDLECDGGDLCGRTKKHLPHSYTRGCGCRATNRTYQRHRQQAGLAR